MVSKTSPPRTVLFITRKWPPAVGGMETYSARLTGELARRVNLDLAALPGRANGLPPTAWSILGFAAGVARDYLRRKEPPAIIHIGDMACWPFALLARFGNPRPAVLLSAHGTDVSYHRRGGWKGRLYGAYLRLGAWLNRNATVIANSSATARVAAESGWLGVAVVPLATDLAGSASVPPHGRHLLFAGRLIEQKGCLWFVRNVLPLLPPEIRLKVAGPIWAKAEAAILDDPRVDYLGSLDKDALVAEYRNALCVIVPNIEPASGEFEGFGLVAVEASAVGGVVLASATGGLVEAVIDGETGFLVPPGDPPAWRDKIAKVAAWDETRRSEYLTAAIARSRQAYSWGRVADDVVKIYDGALAAEGQVR